MAGVNDAPRCIDCIRILHSDIRRDDFQNANSQQTCRWNSQRCSLVPPMSDLGQDRPVGPSASSSSLESPWLMWHYEQVPRPLEVSSTAHATESPVE
jgi:hypothetical protein